MYVLSVILLASYTLFQSLVVIENQEQAPHSVKLTEYCLRVRGFAMMTKKNHNMNVQWRRTLMCVCGQP
jgi:hypothetical protein